MTFYESIRKKGFLPTIPFNDDLPISQTHPSDTHIAGLRRRIASFSVKIQPLSSAATSAWALRRSKSLPAIPEFGSGPLRRWWESGLSWILSKKPAFTQDLEMNEEEARMLGQQSKGSWRHVFYRVRSGIRRLVGPTTLPTTQKFTCAVAS